MYVFKELAVGEDVFEVVNCPAGKKVMNDGWFVNDGIYVTKTRGTATPIGDSSFLFGFKNDTFLNGLRVTLWLACAVIG